MRVYYRLSNPSATAGGQKEKISTFDKIKCLRNAVREFGKENITIIGDRLSPQFKQLIQEMKDHDVVKNGGDKAPYYDLRLIEVNYGSGAGTYRYALDLAIEENKDQDVVYLLEDDFLHKKGAKNALLEGCRYEQYTTVYDHPDKYLDANRGGNPHVANGGEATRLMWSGNYHWKITNSTVFTFATKIGRLKLDYNIHQEFSKGKITDSYGMFMALNQKGIGCISSVPGLSTHCELKWLSPGTGWDTYDWMNDNENITYRLSSINNIVENPATKGVRLEREAMITDNKPLDPNRNKSNDDIIVTGM